MDAQTQTATIGHNSAGVREILTEDPQAIFRDEAMLATLCAELEEEIDQAEVNLDTAAARGEIASRAFAITKIKTALDKAGKDRNEEAAELERLRKAEGERLAREAEEARQKAAAKAEADRIAAEKAREERLAREAEDRARKAAEEKAAQERLKAEREAAAKLAAERKAKEAAERKLREQEEAAEAERKAQAKREADARHRELIQAEVSAGIVRVTGLSGAKATALIIAILAGEIPHTSIKF